MAPSASSADRPSPAFDRRQFLGLSAAAGAVLAFGTACGAGGSSAAGGSGGSSGGAGALTVLCEGGGKIELAPIAAKFTADTGTKVNLVELPYDGLFNRLSGELARNSSSADVLALDSIWLPLFSPKLEPIPDLFPDEVRSDLFPSLVGEAQTGGSFIGMPVWTNTEVLLYRKDLFESAAEKAAFQKRYGYELAPPKDWKTFTDAAIFFTRPGQKLYGSDVKGAVETEWLAHVLQAGSPGVVLDADNNVIIDNDAHLQALTFYADLHNKHKIGPPGPAQIDWAAAQNLFNQGRTAMTRFWAHAYRQIPKDSPVAGKVGVAPMIAGPAGVAGIPGPWYLSVPKGGKQTDAAKKFVKAAYDDNALSLTTTLGLAARKSAYQEYQGKPGYEAFGPLLATLDAPATKVRPPVAKWQQIVNQVLIPMLQKAVTPGADYAALLKQARGQVERLVA